MSLGPIWPWDLPISVQAPGPHTRPPGPLDRWRRALQKARDDVADLVQVLAAARQHASKRVDAQRPFGRTIPRVAQDERAHVHARGFLRQLAGRMTRSMG